MSGILGIPASSVKINSVFETNDEPPLPENIYSNISVMTELLKKCCQTLLKRRSDAKLPYTVEKKVSPSQKRVWDKKKFSGTPFHSTSFAAASVEVELDPCTFRERIRKINVIINGGKVMNRPAALNSAKLAIQKVLASLVEDDRLNCPDTQISFMDSDDDPTQIGELMYQVIPAAFTGALSQAIDYTVSSLPLRTDSLYNLICERITVANAKKQHLLERAIRIQDEQKQLIKDLEKQTQEHQEDSNRQASETKTAPESDGGKK